MEQPRNLLTLDQIKNQATSHYPSDFTRTKDNYFIYKKDIVNIKLLGHRVVGGIYGAAAYGYQLDADKFGGFASVGAGAYVRSPLYTNDWSYFLAGGATARFQGDKVVFNIGHLQNGRFTQRSYARTLQNPWPELSGKIAEIFNKESSLKTKLNELIKEVRSAAKGTNTLSIPTKITNFGNQCLNLSTLFEKFLTDDENLHTTQCLEMLGEGVREVIQKLESFIRTSSAPQKLKNLA